MSPLEFIAWLDGYTERKKSQVSRERIREKMLEIDPEDNYEPVSTVTRFCSGG